MTSGRRFSVAILVTLAAAAGAAVTLVVGAIAIQVGPWADRKATSARCQCDGADATAAASAQLAEENGELKRAFLAGLVRDPRCDDTPTRQAEEPTPPEPPTEDLEELEVPSPEEVVAQEKSEVASLQDELNQEPVDPVWAPATEQATARAVAAAGSMDLEDVTCRESLCRVRVTHRDLAQRADDVEKLLGTMPGGGQARVYAPSDETTTVMYFSRKGMQLSVMTPRGPWFPPPPLAGGEGENQPPAQLAN